MYMAFAALIIIAAAQSAYAQVDLALSDLELSAVNVEEGRFLLASVDLDNLGQADAKNIWVYFYIGRDDSGEIFARSRVTALPAGGSKKINAYWTTDELEYSIFVSADPKGLIPETDEANNDISGQITLEEITGPSDPAVAAEEEEGQGGTGLPFGALEAIIFLVVAIVIVAVIVAPLVVYKTKEGYYVMPSSLYAAAKASKALYGIRNRVLADMKVIYTTADSKEPFLTSTTLDEKDQRLAKEIKDKYGVAKDYADAIALTKKHKAILLISSKQIWVENVGRDLKFETKVVL